MLQIQRTTSPTLKEERGCIGREGFNIYLIAPFGAEVQSCTTSCCKQLCTQVDSALQIYTGAQKECGVPTLTASKRAVAAIGKAQIPRRELAHYSSLNEGEASHRQGESSSHALMMTAIFSVFPPQCSAHAHAYHGKALQCLHLFMKA